MWGHTRAKKVDGIAYGASGGYAFALSSSIDAWPAYLDYNELLKVGGTFISSHEEKIRDKYRVKVLPTIYWGEHES